MVRVAPAGGHIRFEISDRGAGMPPEVLARVGEPFFTTKPAGKGMGLGVFLARAVADRLGGAGTIRSTPGTGTSVVLSRCRCDESAWSARAAAGEVSERSDAAAMHDAARRRRRGVPRAAGAGAAAARQEVVTAADGDEAVRAGARQAGRRGRRPAHAGRCRARAGPQLLALQPELRVVVLTGYGSIASAVEAMRLGAHNYVSKPADADDVLAPRARGRAAPPGRTAGCAAPTLARAEWEHIQRILADTGGNVSETARRLGITGARCSSS